MPASALASYHLWLLEEAPRGGPAIVLHGAPAPPPGLAPEVARYLNEFDDEALGRWINITPALFTLIAATPEERRRLGVREPCPQCPAQSACGLRKVHEALARRGHVVLEGLLAFEASANLRHIFRATLGGDGPDPSRVHLALRPELFDDRSLPSIIGDTFLGWQATRRREDPA